MRVGQQRQYSSCGEDGVYREIWFLWKKRAGMEGGEDEKGAESGRNVGMEGWGGIITREETRDIVSRISKEGRAKGEFQGAGYDWSVQGETWEIE